MKIGYSVQGSTDRAVLEGLRKRWCRDADAVEGRFRGSTNLSLRREYRKICDEFLARSVTVMVFLTDSDEGPWREVQKNERSKFPAEWLSFAIHGVADRNVECWICAAPAWLGSELHVDPSRFTCAGPKAAFEKAMGISRDDKKEREISELVHRAPLQEWLSNESFEDFYGQVRSRFSELDCSVENLLDNKANPSGGERLER